MYSIHQWLLCVRTIFGTKLVVSLCLSIVSYLPMPRCEQHERHALCCRYRLGKPGTRGRQDTRFQSSWEVRNGWNGRWGFSSLAKKDWGIWASSPTNLGDLTRKMVGFADLKQQHLGNTKKLSRDWADQAYPVTNHDTTNRHWKYTVWRLVTMVRVLTNGISLVKDLQLDATTYLLLPRTIPSISIASISKRCTWWNRITIHAEKESLSHTS